jgi:hypothetical protein
MRCELGPPSVAFSAVRSLLPDGSTFFSAGRVDMLASGLSFVTVPDVGTTRGGDAFCAALAG